MLWVSRSCSARYFPWWEEREPELENRHCRDPSSHAPHAAATSQHPCWDGQCQWPQLHVLRWHLFAKTFSWLCLATAAPSTFFSPALPDIVATATKDESPGSRLGGFPQGARPTRLLDLVHLVNWFATIDLKDIYFHIEVAPKHRKFHPAKLVLHLSQLAFAISWKRSNPYLSNRWRILGVVLNSHSRRVVLLEPRWTSLWQPCQRLWLGTTLSALTVGAGSGVHSSNI